MTENDNNKNNKSNNKDKNNNKNKPKLIRYGNPRMVVPSANSDTSNNTNPRDSLVNTRDDLSTNLPAVNENNNENPKDFQGLKDGQMVITKKQLQSMISTIQSRAILSGMLGKTFGGERDLYEVLGYKKTLQFDDYFNRFKRDNIAKRIISAPAEATWANGPIITVVEEGDNKRKIQEFGKIWNDLVIKKKLLSKLSRADKLSGIGTFGILLIGINDGRDLSKPLGKAKVKENDKASSILYISAYSERDVDIREYDDDVQSERFGLPKMYTVNATGGITGSTTSLIRTLDVHHSRIVHIAEGLLENEIFGTPRLEAVYNLFDDLAKTVGGSAEFFWKSADRGIHWDIDKDMEIETTNEAELSDEIDSYEHGLKRNVKTRGIRATVLGSETADPRGPFTSIMSLIAGATGIPQRILMGSERGQLASSQDRSSWNERIGERQQIFAEPCMLRPFIDILIVAGILPEIDYGIEWPVIFPQTEDEKSVVAQRYAVAAKTASQQVEGNKVITTEEFGQKYMDVQTVPDNEKEKKDAEKLEEKKEENKIAIVPDLPIDDRDIKESPGEQSARKKEPKAAQVI